MQALRLPNTRMRSAGVQSSHAASCQSGCTTGARRAVMWRAAPAQRAPPRCIAHTRRSVAVAAQQQQDQQPGSSGDSDLAFVAKGIAISFAGGALIKYGSLLIDLPHSPNAAVALAMVLGPPLLYAAILASRGGSQQGGSS